MTVIVMTMNSTTLPDQGQAINDNQSDPEGPDLPEWISPITTFKEMQSDPDNERYFVYQCHKEAEVSLSFYVAFHSLFRRSEALHTCSS